MQIQQPLRCARKNPPSEQPALVSHGIEGNLSYVNRGIDQTTF